MSAAVFLAFLAFFRTIFPLVDRASRLAQPPLRLLANCLGLLSVFARRRRGSHSGVWDRLDESGLFPHFGRRRQLVVSLFLNTSLCGIFLTNSLLQQSTTTLEDEDLSPGIVGSLLAQHECVAGEYPLTSAFLDLLFTCADGSRY